MTNKLLKKLLGIEMDKQIKLYCNVEAGLIGVEMFRLVPGDALVYRCEPVILNSDSELELRVN